MSLFLTHLLLEVTSPITFSPSPFCCRDLQEAKDSINEEDPRPTSSTWSYIIMGYRCYDNPKGKLSWDWWKCLFIINTISLSKHLSNKFGLVMFKVSMTVMFSLKVPLTTNSLATFWKFYKVLNTIMFNGF